MGGSSSKNEEVVPPDYPKRKKTPYDEEWARQIRHKTLDTGAAIPFPQRSEDGGEDQSNCEQLETLVDKVKDLYETTDTDNHPAKILFLFKCLSQAWAGVCVVRAFVALCENEKSDFDALSAKIEEKFTELRARDSVIRLRGYVWEIERLLNRPVDENTSDRLDKNVNSLMQELMVEGSASALEEIYACLQGGHRTKMERYVLHVLHFLFNGMNKNNELLLAKFGRIKAEEYVRRQYSLERQDMVTKNVCRILGRFDEELTKNLEKDFDEHYKDFDFLTSKYDWLHLHLTDHWRVITPDHCSAYFTSDFTPRLFKRCGEYYYYLHYIPKDEWVDPTEDEISTARRALREANGDFKPGDNRHVLMAKRLNQHGLAWWGIFYGDRNAANFKFSSGYPAKCSVVEWMDPYEWRVLLCGRS